MNELHIVTVGVSLLSNFSKEAGIAFNEVHKHAQQVQAYMKENQKSCCAEISSLQARCGMLNKKKDKPAVTLIESYNRDGRFACSQIAKFLKTECGVQVGTIKLAGLDVAALDNAEKKAVNEEIQAALMTVREKVQRHVEKEQKQHPDLQVQFNMTGGYKAEVAVLYELGRFLRVPVYYLHESYRIPVELP